MSEEDLEASSSKHDTEFESVLEQKSTDEKQELKQEEPAAKSDEETTEYNNFNYWRNSIPSLEENIDLNEKVK